MAAETVSFSTTLTPTIREPTEEKGNGKTGDPILDGDDRRHAIFPIVFDDLWRAYKTQESLVWHAHDVDLSKDIPDWNKLPIRIRNAVKRVLAFFAKSDLTVNENIARRFRSEIKALEAEFGYNVQAFIEGVHSEMYAMIIESYIRDPTERAEVFRSVETNPSIKRKDAWARKYMNSDCDISELLMAFVMVEGIFFSSSFCIIYWLKSNLRVLPGLCKSNDYISRDEGMHTDFGILLHSKLRRKCPADIFENMMRDAVAIEHEFCAETLPEKLDGMNAESMQEYVCFIANRIAKLSGYAEIWPKATNPFDFMDRISLTSKSNFFETRPTEYAHTASDIGNGGFDFVKQNFKKPVV